MSDFIPAGELVRANQDIKRADGSVAVAAGTSGVLENRDDLIPGVYWVTFQGAAFAIAVRESEIEPIPPHMEARAWVSEAMSGLPGMDSCAVCAGPLVAGEERICRGCSDGHPLDAAVEADLEPGVPAAPAAPRSDTPLDR